MGRVRAQQRRRAAGALVAVLLATAGLPLLHAIDHHADHVHVGGAIAYDWFDGVHEHEHEHEAHPHDHEHDQPDHEHGPPDHEEQEHDGSSNEAHGAGDLTHLGAPLVQSTAPSILVGWTAPVIVERPRTEQPLRPRFARIRRSRDPPAQKR